LAVDFTRNGAIPVTINATVAVKAVEVRMVGQKKGNKLFVRGKEFTL
jgi:hypothetical protein